MREALAALMIGATLFGAAPALAGNTADIIQQGGGYNSIKAKQSGYDNDFAAVQDGYANRLKLKQRGCNNTAGVFQDGLFNKAKLKQKQMRWC